MNQIDIAIKKVCVYCKIEFAFHHPDDNNVPLTTLSEHSTTTLRILDTFVNCPKCGEPFFLRIQAQPYDIHNHLDNPVAVYLARQLDQETGRELSESPEKDG